jgi:HlyD family secretion protein
MSKANSKKRLLRTLVVVAVVVVAALLVFKYWRARQSALPAGIVSGNGRIESKLVDVAAKEPLRVKEILVDEGDTVAPGQVLVRLGTVTLDAELAEAKAKVATAQERVAIANAAIVKRKSEIELAKIEVERARKLVEQRAASQREYDLRQTAVDKQWWRAFNDPALDQLIQLAYQQNLPLQIAGLRILESRAR